MIPDLPQIVVSRDGRRSILLESVGTDLARPSTFDGFPVDSIVRLRPRGVRHFINVKVSDTFRRMWDAPRQTLRWNEDFSAAVPELALIAPAEFLDSNEVPDDPIGDEYALTVSVSSYLFDIFKQDPPSEGLLRQYVEGKIYWTWKFKAEPAVFAAWEARRLNTDLDDFHQAAFVDNGSLWEVDAAGGYRALPALIRRYENAPTATSITAGPRPTYDVALSFAGEQRAFVNAVATVLKDEGAAVFYDEFADLWGKDLTIELERVYRSASRFVVIFISEAYVAKAWTNLERQHALAGRMERMDDSVLPARFDPIALPGLPITVGYLDIGDRSPRELALLVLAKVKT